MTNHRITRHTRSDPANVQACLGRIHKYQRLRCYAERVLVICKSLCWAMIWGLICGQALPVWGAVVMGVGVGGWLLASQWPGACALVTAQALVGGYEVLCPAESSPLWEEALSQEALLQEGRIFLNAQEARSRQHMYRGVAAGVGQWGLSVVVLGWCLYSFGANVAGSWAEKVLPGVVSGGVGSVTLSITEGAADPALLGREFVLKPSLSPEVFVLTTPHILQLRCTLPKTAKAILELRTPAGELIQSFQGVPTQEDGNVYGLPIALHQEAQLFVPALGTAPWAWFRLNTPPKPEVRLQAVNLGKGLWPDHQPLPLKIWAQGHSPLKDINLLIRIGGKEFKEWVNTVAVEDLHTFSRDYSLVLDRFMEADVVDMEIQAEAWDGATPQPLRGLSKTLRIRVMSAYGRYKQTLETLARLKQSLDQKVAARLERPSSEDLSGAKQAWDQAGESPFFDSGDRGELARFAQTLEEAARGGGRGAGKDAVGSEDTSLWQVSQSLGRFLHEHEMLDDRQRDRDFFVAARGLSALWEEGSQEAAQLAQLESFVEERRKRWDLRVQHLGLVPTGWPGVQDTLKGHFQRLQQDTLPRGDVPGSLAALATLVSDYRTWIQSLEAAEDEARRKQETLRQEGLAASQDLLRGLQRVQGEVSLALDKAETRSEGDLKEQWVLGRLKQTDNLQASKALVPQLQSQSMEASSRLTLAIEAMEAALQQGDRGAFVPGESYADLAGRWLRQSLQDAQSSASQEPRSQRKRAVGDEYYGRAVYGGDVNLERRYQVDRRFRDDVLDNAQKDSLSPEERPLLDSYLRKLLR